MYAAAKGLNGLRSRVSGRILTAASLIAGFSVHACRIAPPTILRISWRSLAYIVPTVSDSSITRASYALRLPQPYAGKVLSLRQLAGELSGGITMLSEVIADLLAGDRGYQVIQQLPGIGPVLAAVIIAEIGDAGRFRTTARLCS
jgi:transposase